MGEFQSFINLGAAALLGLVGWFSRTAYTTMQSDVRELRKQIEAMERHVLTTYVPRPELMSLFAEIKQQNKDFYDTIKAQNKEMYDNLDKFLTRIETKLDSKADK